MKASDSVLMIAPAALRKYFLCFIFVPFNVFAAYYLQAVKQVKESVTLSALRGFLLSGLFLYLFPVVFGAQSIWYVMVCAECIVSFTAVVLLNKKIQKET